MNEMAETGAVLLVGLFIVYALEALIFRYGRSSSCSSLWSWPRPRRFFLDRLLSRFKRSSTPLGQLRFTRTRAEELRKGD